MGMLEQIWSFISNILEEQIENCERQYKKKKYELERYLSDKTDDQIRRAYENSDNLNQLQKECIEEEMIRRRLLKER